MKLRLAWQAWRRRAAACVVDGDQLADLFMRAPRRPLDCLLECLNAGSRSVVLLVDHAHVGAADVLHSVQQCHAEQFAAGAVVIGVENLPRDDGEALASYRRIGRAPVFGVDLSKAADVLLLSDALVATRVAATLLLR